MSRRLTRAGDRPLASAWTGLLIAAALLVAPACGKKGPPSPPDPRGPLPPTGVTARQIGSKIDVHFDVPEPRGRKPGEKLRDAELVRVAFAPGLPVPADPAVFRRRGEIVNAVGAERLTSGERARLADIGVAQLEDSGKGWTLRYAIRVYDQRGRSSAVVVASDLVPVESRPAPVGLSAEPTVDGVRLVWQPVEPPPEPVSSSDIDTSAVPDEPQQAEAEADEVEALDTADDEGGEDDEGGDGDDGDEAASGATDDVPATVMQYNLYRARPGEPVPERPIHVRPLTEAEYLDIDVAIGSRYVYYVRLILAAGLPSRESSSSPGLEVLVADRFAPEVPEALVAVQEGLAVRLFWRPNRDRDLAGYRVYRKVDEGPERQIGRDPLDQPTLLDEDVTVGQRLTYRVTAVDRATPANESDRSEAVTVVIQAEPEAAEGLP